VLALLDFHSLLLSLLSEISAMYQGANPSNLLIFCLSKKMAKTLFFVSKNFLGGKNEIHKTFLAFSKF
jgi:hypothetical protein